MTIKQLSVFVENEAGRLAEITAILEQHQIDIRAMSLADTTSFGVLRLIVDRPNDALKAIKNAGFNVSLTDVIAIGVADIPGGLSDSLTILSQNGVVVEYMYAFISRQQGRAYVIMRTDNNQRALDVIKANHIPVLTESEIVTVND